MMESVLQLYGLAMVILPVYAFVSLRKRIRHEHLSMQAALLRYIGLVIAPIATYACVYGLGWAIDAIVPFSVVPQEAIPGFVLAVVLGVLVWLLATATFLLSLIFMQKPAGPNSRGNRANVVER
ncbi:MAG: hypothetical protein PVH25_14280 [Burkholderiales bacterium]|jgi:hypothetical protein